MGVSLCCNPSNVFLAFSRAGFVAASGWSYPQGLS